jgi:hypothetical protein
MKSSNDFDMKSYLSARTLKDQIFFSGKRFNSLILKSKTKFQAANQNKSSQISLILLYLIVSNVMNLISIILFILSTMFNDDEIIYILNIIDAVVATYFVFEYLALLYYHKGRKRSYIFTWVSFIEISSIFNSYFSFVSGDSTYRFQFLRIFRILRIYRMLRIYKSLKFFKNILANNDSVIRTNPIKLQFFQTVVILISYLFFGTGIILAANDILPVFGLSPFSQENLNFIDAFYFMVVTSLSIGYGDITPVSGFSRILIITILFGFIVIVSDQLSKIVNLLNIWGNGLVEYTGRNHIIVILDTLYCFEHFLNEIRRKEPETDVVIISSNIENIPTYEKVALIHGRRIGYDTFIRSNLLLAKVVFIIAPKGINDKIMVEQLTEFTLLKVNDHNSDIPIYIQTLYEEYVNIKYRFRATSNKDILEETKQVMTSFKFKKIIPVFKIKSQIHAKSTINPGFACFAQNLLFNKKNYFIKKKKYTSELLSAYMTGCEYKIHYRNAPSCFIGKTFKETVYSVYIRSIGDYLQKTKTNENDVRTFLVIGVMDREDDESEEAFTLFPYDYIVHEETKLVVIAYDNEAYVNNFFNKIETETFNKLMKQKNSHKNKTFLEGAARLKKKRDDDDDDILILNEMKELNQYYFNKNRNAGATKVEEFGVGLLKTLIKKAEPETYEEFKQKDIRGIEINKETYIEQLLKEEKHKEVNTIVKGYNISEIANLDHLVHEEDEHGNPDGDFAENLEALRLSRCKGVFSFSEDLYKYYGQYRTPIQCTEPLINNERIKNIEKDFSRSFKNHFLIIGYQCNIEYLIRLISYHYPLCDICIINYDTANEQSIQKLLVDFSNLYYFKGNNLDPTHLLNAGINHCFKCVFLVENIDKVLNEDINKILSFRSIDYFFNQETIIELWNESSIKYLGYSPLNEDDLFLHPLYMSGNVMFMSHLEKVIANSYISEPTLDAWASLVSCGYDVVEKYIPDRENYPVIITVDIPEYYHGLDYYMLVNDLLEQDSPVIPLGIYIGDPSHYYNSNLMGNEKISDESVFTSARRFSRLTELETRYFEYMEILKRNSYNKKPYLDYVDMSCCLLPLFITNPSPGFTLHPDTKVMVLVNHKISHNEYNYKGNDIFKFKNLSIAQNFTKKAKIARTVNRFYYLFNKIKDKFNEEYRHIVEEFNDDLDDI